MINVTAATTKELVEFWNAHTDKPVKRFSDRAAAERRVNALIEEKGLRKPAVNSTKDPVLADIAKVTHEGTCPNCGINMQENGVDYDEDENEICMACGHGAKEEPTETDPVRSAAIAKSWEDPEVKAKRSTRHFVRVDGEEFRSVRAAFIALQLPLNEHIRFRMLLKAEGKLRAYGANWEAFEA